MKKTRKFDVAVALGSLTAAVGLLAGVPEASAQVTPGGGSFPGSFLVPGTNTSIKIGGFVKIVGIEDLSARNGDTIAVDAQPLNGSANSSLNKALRFHARQSNVNFDTRTPTAYGDLTTFILLDFFGQNTSETRNQANTNNARMVYAYGTLGPFLAGQWLSLWADTDAVPESVDPTGFISVMDGLTNRQPQFRYTYAAPGGFSAAVSIEEPVVDGISGTAGTAFTTSSLGGIDRTPDIIARARMDQAWGHAAVSAIYRELKVVAPGLPHVTKSAYGGELSGHLNTFGKDSLKATAMMGKGLGHYFADMRTSGGLQTNTAFTAAGTPTAYGINVGYTHWWTTALRSSIDAGYSRARNQTGLGISPAALDKRHYGGRVNLIWSPVPQVDLGIEYDYAHRVVESGATGNLNRVEIESVFKF